MFLKKTLLFISFLLCSCQAQDASLDGIGINDTISEKIATEQEAIATEQEAIVTEQETPESSTVVASVTDVDEKEIVQNSFNSELPIPSQWKIVKAFDMDQKPIELRPSTDPPVIVISFEANNLLISGSCNQLTTTFNFTDKNKITTQNISTGSVYCSEPIMNSEALLFNFFNQQVLDLNFATLDNSLGITNNQLGVIVLNPINEPHKSVANTETNEIESKSVYMEIQPNPICEDESCYLVREVFYNNLFQKTYSDWRHLDFTIEKLSLSPDTRTLVKLKKYQLNEPDAIPKYVLDTVIEQSVLK